MVEVLQQVALKDGSEPLALDQETSWRLEDALERAKAARYTQLHRLINNSQGELFIYSIIKYNLG
jgi:hypothetical protein